MSKNLIVLFIIILLIVGGFGIYTYDQSNQVKKEVEEKNFELGSKDELILELKENIQEKEKQIEELKANLAKGEKDLEQEYTDKLSELTEEKAKFEALLTEKEETIKTIEKQKEESEQIVILKDELVLELKENIQEKEKQIKELKDNLVQQGIEGEKDYVAELSALTEEKSTLETQLNTSQGLLLEKESTITILNQQNEESKKNLMEKDKTVTELAESIKGYENQIKEISELMVKEGKEKEAEYAERLALLTEEKSTLETQLNTSQGLLLEKESTITILNQQNEESKKNLMEKDKTVTELAESIKGYENQIKEISELMAKEGKEKEAEYAERLALLTEEKSTLETQLNTSQGLLLEKESTITILNQQNEESKKNLMEKDKTVTELAESIKGYENQIKEISELMAKEGKEKEAEYAERLALLEER